MKTDHILIMRFSAMGDVAMTVPVVYALAKEYPNLRITMLSQPFARPLFEDLAPNVSFMEADIKEEYKGIKGLNSLYRRLVAKQFTAIADLHNVLRSSYLRMRFNLSQNNVAHLDKHRDLRKQLTAVKDKVMEPIPTAFDNYKRRVRQVGLSNKEHRLQVDIHFQGPVEIAARGDRREKRLPAMDRHSAFRGT